MPFSSQAQQRFAFGTGQPWAKRWADETDFSKLPKRVRRIRSRKVKGCTCGDAVTTKGEQLAPGITRIRGNLCNVHGRYGPCDAGASGKKPKGGKGKKPKAAKPKKAALTPEQRAAARSAQQDQNRANVANQMADNDKGLSPPGTDALTAMAKGQQPSKALGDGLVKMGLAELARDGTYRMSGTGRSTLNAMNAGDYQRALDTISRGTDQSSARADRTQARTERQAAAAQRKTEVAARRAAAQQKREAAAKKPTGSGAAKPPAPASEPVSDKRSANRERVLRDIGVDDTTASALQELASGAQPTGDVSSLVSSGLIEQDSTGQYRMSTSGRVAMNAAAQDNAGAARDAISRGRDRAQAQAERTADRDTRRSAAERRRAVAAARAETAATRQRTKAFVPDRLLGAGHTGVMVALRPDLAAAQEIAAQPDVTEPIEQLHLTLCYLGDSTETPLATNKDTLLRALMLWAYTHSHVLNGTINGAGRFFHSEDNDTNAVFVAPDVPGLPELRQTLIQWIEQSGFDYSRDHGFTPHITVAYVPTDAPTPPIRIDTPVTFDRVTLGWGDEQYDIPMGGSAVLATKAETYGGVKRSNLDDSVFAGPDRSFPIKTAQDVRDAARSLGRTKHDKRAVRRGIIRRARAIGATAALPESWQTKESFTVLKDFSGADRWISVSSTAYRDRDSEIVSTKALQGAVALADASGWRGPLRFWHVPGVEIGDCDYQATAQDGRFLIESGTFRSPALAAAVKSRARGYQVSIGFTHPANEPDQHGVFTHIAIFERSLVPQGRASNPFTQLATKESKMLTTEKAAALKELLGGDESLLTGLLGNVATTDKAAQDSGVAYKDTDTPAWAQALLGRIEALETSLKAAAPPAEVVADEAPVETKDDGMGDMEMMAEGEDEGDNFLSPAELSAITNAVVQSITPLLNIEQKMSGYVNEMKSLVGGMATQKDAALSEVKEELTAVKAQVADLSGSQPRIMAGGYRASQASATVTTDETKLKDAQPSADPVQQSVAAFLADMGFGGPQQPTA